jgi:hypothetical protein
MFRFTNAKYLKDNITYFNLHNMTKKQTSPYVFLMYSPGPSPMFLVTLLLCVKNLLRFEGMVLRRIY